MNNKKVVNLYISPTCNGGASIQVNHHQEFNYETIGTAIMAIKNLIDKGYKPIGQENTNYPQTCGNFPELFGSKQW